MEPLLPTVTRVPHQYPRIIHKRANELVKRRPLVLRHGDVVPFQRSREQQLRARDFEFEFMEGLLRRCSWERMRGHLCEIYNKLFMYRIRSFRLVYVTEPIGCATGTSRFTLTLQSEHRLGL